MRAALQRPDGMFVHFTDGRIAWGRGNGFAALGLTEALTSLPAEPSVTRAGAGMCIDAR